jgi:hypothetical protein
MFKTLAWMIGIVVVCLVVAVLGARVFGFNPGPTRPGMWLTGEVVNEPVTDWSFAEKVRGLTAIETRQWFLPMLAHSVTTGRFHNKGRLYFASGYPAGIKLPEGRHWNRNVQSDPHVRIRIGDKLYDGTLVYLTDPVEREDLLRAIGPMFWSPGFFLHVWRFEQGT